jgi:hypothetical protein
MDHSPSRLNRYRQALLPAALRADPASLRTAIAEGGLLFSMPLLPRI